MSAPSGNVGVVTGGSRGLGRVLVERLLSDGWRVATFSRKANDFTERTAEKYTKDFYWEPADLRDAQSLRGFTRAVESIFGRVDLLVNNGGVLHQELFLTTAGQRMQDVVATNLLAPMQLAQLCARLMMRTGGGSIVNVSSINAVRGYRGVAPYSAAKAGLDGLTRSLARELGPLNIRVNTVTPGFFDSEMTAEVTSVNREKIRNRTPLGRLGTAEEIADAVTFLGSSQAGFITGQTLVVDGGITC